MLGLINWNKKPLSNFSLSEVFSFWMTSLSIDLSIVICMKVYIQNINVLLVIYLSSGNWIWISFLLTSKPLLLTLFLICSFCFIIPISLRSLFFNCFVSQFGWQSIFFPDVGRKQSRTLHRIVDPGLRICLKRIPGIWRTILDFVDDLIITFVSNGHLKSRMINEFSLLSNLIESIYE